MRLTGVALGLASLLARSYDCGGSTNCKVHHQKEFFVKGAHDYSFVAVDEEGNQHQSGTYRLYVD